MTIIEETKKNQWKNSERRGEEEAADKLPTQSIIDFEFGRKALERARLEKGQRRAALLERSRLPWRLPEDWLEFAVTMGLVFALLFGLYVGLIGSW
jgi:hypothetical protein